MKVPVLRVLDPGLGAAIQDTGRPGWGRFGVPLSGVMDDHAAALANALLENPPQAPVCELVLQGARFEVLTNLWVAAAGAEVQATIPLWEAVHLEAGTELSFRRNICGVWLYLAVAHGFHAEKWFDSTSTYRRGLLGTTLQAGDVLCCDEEPLSFVPAVARRSITRQERRDYHQPPPLRIYPAPQWPLLAEPDRVAFLSGIWQICPESDRMGYRLKGVPLTAPREEMVSEPILVGTIQLPPNGQPIVTMRDGPTVGGYPKIALVHPADLSWLAQCRAGQTVRFQLMTGDET